jgi:hypothetical protein
MYLLDANSLTRCVVLDADDPHGFERLRSLSSQLTKEDIPAYLEASRRGGHLWLFLAQSVPARSARQFGTGLLDAYDFKDVELYPKQDCLSKGPGSLIRMPFGVHRLTGQRYGFYGPDGTPLGATIRDQLDALSTPECVPEAVFESYRAMIPFPVPKTALHRSEGATGHLSERIKSSISVLDFVSQYVDLRESGSGAVGHCPFHDDQHPSFAVNDRDNYWHCFAGCGGGSLIDFWIKWRDCNFQQALRELAELLL